MAKKRVGPKRKKVTKDIKSVVILPSGTVLIKNIRQEEGKLIFDFEFEAGKTPEYLEKLEAELKKFISDAFANVVKEIDGKK
jgi:hypothetical protein